MRIRSLASVLTVATLLVALVPASALAGAPARLEGRVVGLDGRPAAGHGVLLIGADGAVAARSAAGEDGVYRFPAVAAGTYALAIERPDGAAAPVVGSETALKAGQLARLDVKLVRSEPNTTLAPAQVNGGLGIWWAGLTPAAKAWWIVGGSVVIGVAIASIDNGKSRREPPASASSPYPR